MKTLKLIIISFISTLAMNAQQVDQSILFNSELTPAASEIKASFDFTKTSVNKLNVYQKNNSTVGFPFSIKNITDRPYTNSPKSFENNNPQMDAPIELQDIEPIVQAIIFLENDFNENHNYTNQNLFIESAYNMEDNSSENNIKEINIELQIFESKEQDVKSYQDFLCYDVTASL